MAKFNVVGLDDGDVYKRQGYDRYSAQYLIDDLKNAGWQTDDVWQGENLSLIHI